MSNLIIFGNHVLSSRGRATVVGNARVRAPGSVVWRTTATAGNSSISMPSPPPAKSLSSRVLFLPHPLQRNTDRHRLGRARVRWLVATSTGRRAWMEFVSRATYVVE